MSTHHHLAAIVLLLSAAPSISATRCSFMTEIPRPERPEELEYPDFKIGTPWAVRPLWPLDPEHEQVCVEDFPASEASRDQIIYMDEEIDGDVYIAKLNYIGEAAPAIVQVYGVLILLGPEIRSQDGEWFLVITQRQDFETPGMQQYLFDITAPGESVAAQVTLIIVNIDDNAPIIHPRNDTCTIDELGEIGLTECTWEITDVDGWISISQMTFRIDSNRRDDEIFFLQGDTISGVFNRMYMTIGLHETLNFVTNPLHVFNITAMDSKPNEQTMITLVQVNNVESRPPRWTEFSAVQQFDEKTNQSFTIQAMDGDTGIDKPIYYEIITDPRDDFFSIETIYGGRHGAIFNVSEIDRDYLEREVFQVKVIAYKYDNRSFYAENDVVIIVNDVNDQRPEPLAKEYTISIMEETPQTLSFSEPFGFHDRDLGENAQYNVTLEDIYPVGAASAFYVAPEMGYQRQTFIMGTLNHSMLDYEVKEFQEIAIKVIAMDINNTDFIGEIIVYISLINWNDEEPIFEFANQIVSFNETEGEGFYVATARAKDRDCNDTVVHSLLGNAGDFLTIDEETGEIFVSANDSFDFHRQSELFVQIRAIDTLGDGPWHTATAQLVIQLYDINNTPPTLRLARGSPSVEENVPQGYEIHWNIRATDPDTTAELIFEIDWETSYATKQGRETDPIHFYECVDIETLYPQVNSRGVADGRITVKEIRDDVTIDFEEFELLYLTIRVRDLNTLLGEDTDESTFTITIIDMNDNKPEWSNGTLDQDFRVTEMAASGAVIGSVLATDIDGPLYNQVRYTIFPREDTPDDDLVMIDFYTGQITVDVNEAIDADDPPRYNLYYTVIASDRCYAENQATCPPDTTAWDTEGYITIRIIDTNNKVPESVFDEEEATELYQYVVHIYENAKQNDPVVQLIASDMDRDEIYHNVSFQINYAVSPRLRDFFAVDLETGLVYVDYTTDEVLDRDNGEPVHEMFITLIDNFFTGGDGRRNQNETTVLVILDDVNDNAPEMPVMPPWSISESYTMGTTLSPMIFAFDRDEPDTNNSRVGYNLHSIQVTNRDDLEEDLSHLFYIETYCVTFFNCSGVLWTNTDLRGYWGTYEIVIVAFDHGDPPLSSNATYELIINPYNFHNPVFVFPEHNSVIRLAREWAVPNAMLTIVGGDFLERVQATDEDGLEAGMVTFEVSGDAIAEEYFEVFNDGENSGILRLREALTGEQNDVQEFQVTIRATDGGTDPHSLSAYSTSRVIFVPTQGEPIFRVDTETVGFFEGDAGLGESAELPAAEDPKNFECTTDCHEIYYRIAEGSNAGGHFALDVNTNVLYLIRELDRNETESHELVIAASNSLTPGPITTGSTLTVTVNVREADPRPIFLSEVYSAGISTAFTINREVLTVEARHSEGVPITYSINETTMTVHPTLENVKDTAFILNPTTGVLTLNMQPIASMHGMFEFEVVATDPSMANGTAEVKVYLISSQNRVYFTFVNTLQAIEEHANFIAQTFSYGFNMTCHIDDVVPSSINGVAQDDRTEVHAHFIRDNVPVPAEEIEDLREDTTLLRLIQTTLNTQLLVLLDFTTPISPEPSDPSLTTIYVLAGLSGLLAFMCIILLITFFVRTRALNKRLQALSMTKYGSVDSGLNRAGFAPGTNQHATGTHPLWNETINAPDFDAVSDVSDNSDLLGVEDLVQFNDDYFPGDVNSLDEIVPKPSRDTVATHGNQFGFNSSPFSTGFSKSNFGK